MPASMDVHSGFVGVTEAELQAAHEADLAIEAEEGAHFERAGHPTAEVYELPVEGA